MKDYFAFAFAGLLLITGSLQAHGERTVELEQSVCGLKEPFIFWLWSSAAGRPDTKRLAGLSNVEV